MNTILVASDLSARSDRAVLRAAHLAAEEGADLIVLHVVDEDLPGALLQTRCEEAETVLRAMIGESAVLVDLAVTVLVEAGHLDRLLPQIVRDRKVDLVVLGTHRSRGLAEILGAPTLTRLLRGVEVPVLVATGRAEVPYDKITVGWDFSPASAAAATLARRLAPEAQITLVHAWQDACAGVPYAFETGGTVSPLALEQLTSEMAREAVKLSDGGPAMGCELVVGPAGHVMHKRAEAGEADLIALGRHARSGIARLLLGATAEDLAVHVPCDVLIAPPE